MKSIITQVEPDSREEHLRWCRNCDRKKPARNSYCEQCGLWLESIRASRFLAASDKNPREYFDNQWLLSNPNVIVFRTHEYRLCRHEILIYATGEFNLPAEFSGDHSV